ncbi:DUF3228 family protein [Candidatus Kuenenbacteria bacterium]|nr:DUF3228 family protein [Candidatus Kuenenbacteria bacterium]
MKETITCNNLIRRQSADSCFSHYEEEKLLVDLVKENFHLAKPGNRDGVVLVPVPPEGFFTGIVDVTRDTKLGVLFQARSKDEDPYIKVLAMSRNKLPAKAVEIVLYHRDVLAENNENSSIADWEIVSINARATEEPEPQNPVSMARNFLDLPGGTKTEYTAEEFARAIIYWSTKAMCA